MADAINIVMDSSDDSRPVFVEIEDLDGNSIVMD